MNSIKKIEAMLATLAITVLSGCSSTEVIESPGAQEKSDEISIALSAPDAFGFPTRANEGLQLRYVAHLWKGATSQSDQMQHMQRKEVLAKDTKTITFNVKETGDYFITIFADYIDDNAVATDGKYPDKYYNTSKSDERVYMLAERGDDGALYDETNINNDNFDCYANKIAVVKTENEYNADLTLNHAVCKVVFKGKAGEKEGVEKVDITEFSFIRECNLRTLDGSVSGSLKINPKTIPYNGNSDELFYFYSFGQTSGALGTIKFDVKGKENYTYQSFTIQGGTFETKANTIITVTGSFFTPTDSPNKQSDNINITVSEDSKWKEDSKNLNN